jgi:PAS domain S-box-containing protein
MTRDTVKVPKELEPIFRSAQAYVTEYFGRKREDPSEGTIEISGERYILVRSASMSVDFFETVMGLYREEGEEAVNVALSLLFDVAHAIGRTDAKSFHQRMNLQDPIAKLSAGPVLFAHTGWAFVDIFSESRPVPDESYMLVYDHPFSFESDAWLKAGRRSDFPVCIMNAGYSSGWCEESFGLTLVASEIMCRAKGDDVCRFVMAPPSKIEEHIREYLKRQPQVAQRVTTYDIPGFFKRKQIEDELKKYRDHLEDLVRQRTEGLTASEERLRALVDAMPDAMLRIGGDGTLLDYKSSREGLAIPPRRYIARSIGEALPTALVERILTQTRRALENGETQVFEHQVSAAGEEREVEFRIVRSGKDEALVIARDITERKRMEAELERARKLESVGILAGGIAHDFNNLLLVIMSNVEMAIERAGPGAEFSLRLDDAKRALKKARGLTHQLLTFAKGGAPVRKTASLAEIIEDSVEITLSGSALEFRCSIDKDLWAVEFDAAQISQVIDNMLINAREAMPGGGVVDIRAGNAVVADGQVPPLRAGNYVKLSIRDQGVGISKEHLSRVFDPFYTTKAGGLGLAICHSIVRKHEGAIIVDSRVGEGTTFTVYLPASGEAPADASVKPETAAAGKGRILLMDDEEMVLKSTAALIRRLGYEVATAKDGREVIDLYTVAMKSAAPYDAVIIDLIVRHGMGGKECIEHLRQIDPGVRAIVSSGYSSDPIMSDFRRFGFCAVVAKPYGLDEIGDVLHQVLESDLQGAPSGAPTMPLTGGKAGSDRHSM